MLVNLGEEPHNKNTTFIVSANIYSEQVNDYIHLWVGGIFNNYDDAYEFWDKWDPPIEEMNSIMEQQRKKGDYSHHELEVGIYSNDPNESRELAFMNKTIDEEHERV